MRTAIIDEMRILSISCSVDKIVFKIHNKLMPWKYCIKEYSQEDITSKWPELSEYTLDDIYKDFFCYFIFESKPREEEKNNPLLTKLNNILLETDDIPIVISDALNMENTKFNSSINAIRFKAKIIKQFEVEIIFDEIKPTNDVDITIDNLFRCEEIMKFVDLEIEKYEKKLLKLREDEEYLEKNIKNLEEEKRNRKIKPSN